MNPAKILAVFRKEVLDSLRDRRTLMVMVMLPIVLYPAMFIFMTQLTSAGMARLRQEQSRVSAGGELPSALDSLLRADTSLVFCPSPDPSADLASRNVWAWLEWRPAADSAVIYYDGAKEKSRLALTRLREAAGRYRLLLQRERLARAGVDPAALEPFGLREMNTAPPSRMGGMVLGILLPVLLIVCMMMGAMYPAMDLTAGEKERGTMETILAAPVDKRELFLGKFLTVAAIAVITGALNLFSMMLTFSAGLVQLGAATGRMEFSIGPASLALVFLSLLPLALFVSAVLLSASLFARSFKDAQNLVTPVYLPLVLLTQVAVMPGIQLNRLLALVPVANVTLLIKDVLLGEYSWDLVLLVFLVNSALAFLAAMFSARLFGSEEVLLGSGKGWHFSFDRGRLAPVRVPPPAAALTVYAAIMLLLFYAAGFLQIRYRHWGLVATEWVLILVPVLTACWYLRADYRETLNLRGFRPLSLIGTLCLALGFVGITVWIGLQQARMFPESVRMAEALRKYLDFGASGLGLGAGLVVAAVGPAVCEEALFRGLLLSSLKGRMRPFLAVLVVSLLFGLSHMSIFRLVPTFVLGLYLTFIVHRTGSVLLSMLAHALNNGLAVALIYHPSLAARLPWLAGETPFPLAALAAFAALAAAGAALVVAGTRDQHGAPW
jgi:sodium transport system permease protein